MRFIGLCSLLLMLAGLCAAQEQTYRLAFKDPQGTIRFYVGDEMALSSMDDDKMWPSVSHLVIGEKVMAARDGISGIKSIVKIKGSQENVAKEVEAALGVDVDDGLGGVFMDHSVTMAYLRRPSGVSLVADANKVSELTPITPEAFEYLDRYGFTFQIPEGELKIGQTWNITGTSRYNISLIELTPIVINYTAQYTLVGVQHIAGKQLLQIDSDCTQTFPLQVIDLSKLYPDVTEYANVTFEQSGVIHMKTTVLFDAKAGEIYSSQYERTENLTSVIKDGARADQTSTKMIAKGKLVRDYDTKKYTAK